jgi:hypothetical protein
MCVCVRRAQPSSYAASADILYGALVAPSGAKTVERYLFSGFEVGASGSGWCPSD